MKLSQDGKRRLAVIASGWHFPLHFYRQMAEQKIPAEWTVDLFCISHRDPKYSKEEKKEQLVTLGWSYPEVLDKVLYEEIATVADIEALGWKYELHPNTIGDFGNTNQWLEKYDYRQYDMFLMSHDDNLLLNNRLFVDLVAPPSDWLILSNNNGITTWKEFIKIRLLGRTISIRGSFEFFKPELLDRMGGKFDLSEIRLTRIGETYSTKSFKGLNNWNMAMVPIRRFLDEQGLAPRAKALSSTYRVSDYCVEGERGFVSSIQPANLRQVTRGLKRIQKLRGELTAAA